MTRKKSVTVRVSHGTDGFGYHYSGDVKDDKGRIEVTGDKGPTKIEFTAAAGDGVDEVSFFGEPKQSIRIGPKGAKACPPVEESDEFDDEQHGNSKKTLSVRDKGNTNGEFRYALFFRVQRTGGQPEDVSDDPMIINNMN